MDQVLALVVMGVAGSGKSVVGSQVAQRLSWPFLDADDFHPPANVEKMKHGVPLNDDDRKPWLDLLHAELEKHVRESHSVILGCSALKEAYRKVLQEALSEVRFVFLDVDRDELLARLGNRTEHFFPRQLLDSQLATLERPTNAFVVNANGSIEKTVDTIVEAVRNQAI